MKKRFLSILAILAVFCIALVGCGGSSKDYSADYVGDWELVEMSADSADDAISADDLATLKDSGLVCVLTLIANMRLVRTISPATIKRGSVLNIPEPG